MRNIPALTVQRNVMTHGCIFLVMAWPTFLLNFLIYHTLHTASHLVSSIVNVVVCGPAFRGSNRFVSKGMFEIST